ncbi:hypothetical protein ACGRHY_25615 [Streptomyces sp. HK10]
MYRVVAGTPPVLAGLPAFTGTRTDVAWSRICPVLLTGPAVPPLVADLA